MENSTRAELDRLGLIALRGMVDVEPYGSSDLGRDPSDDEPPSMTSASPSEIDDPEDPENAADQFTAAQCGKARMCVDVNCMLLIDVVMFLL